MLFCSNSRKLMKYKQHTNKFLTGFTLIELLVVISIIGVILTVTMTSLPSVRVATKASTAAEDVLSLLKETRQRSLSVKELGTTNVFPNYGVALKTATPNAITVYADCIANDNTSDGNVLNDKDNFTDTPSSCSGSNFVKTHTISSPITIRKLRFCPTSACGAAQEVSQLFIEFVRPEPTTWIAKGSNSGGGDVLSSGKAEIDLVDTAGTYNKTVIISTNGLITIQ